MRHLLKEWLVLVPETQGMAILLPESVGTIIAYHKNRRLNKKKPWTYLCTYVTDHGWDLSNGWLNGWMSSSPKCY